MKPFGCGVVADDEGLSDGEEVVVCADAVDGESGGKEGFEESESIQNVIQSARFEGEGVILLAMNDPAKTAPGRWAGELDDGLAGRVTENGNFATRSDQGEIAFMKFVEKRQEPTGEGVAKFGGFAKDVI